MHKIISALAAASAAAFGAANAAVVFDEAVDGDASDGVGTATILGTLNGGENIILGSLEGGPSGANDGTDEFDNYRFTALAPFVLSIDVLSGVDTITFFFENENDLVAAGGPSTADLFGPTFAAGVYTLTFVPAANTGSTSYAFTIDVADAAAVPLPPAAAIMVVGMGALGLARRKTAA